MHVGCQRAREDGPSGPTPTAPGGVAAPGVRGVSSADAFRRARGARPHRVGVGALNVTHRVPRDNLSRVASRFLFATRRDGTVTEPTTSGAAAPLPAIPPATLEGWYALHQLLVLDRAALRQRPASDRLALAEEAAALLADLAEGPDGSWSAPFRVVGSGGADLLLVHFRPTLDALAEVQLRVRASALGAVSTVAYDYLSVTEAGLYHATAQAARAAGGDAAAMAAALAEARAAEGASAHVRSRLYPRVPEGMRYVSFYPMSKRRAGAENWYRLPVDERSRLMRDHGMTGRRFAGKVFQVITGSVGLDDWEWGVTLFAADPLEFKRIVTEMRYDEASAAYGEFGRFVTGIAFAPGEWPALLGAPAAP